jgi:hypothetical protein
MATDGDELRRLLLKLGGYIDDMVARVHDLTGEVVSDIPAAVPATIHRTVVATVVQIDAVVEQLHKLSVHILVVAHQPLQPPQHQVALPPVQQPVRQADEDYLSDGRNISVNDRIPMDYCSYDDPFKGVKPWDSEVYEYLNTSDSE